MSKFLVFYGNMLLIFLRFITADVPYNCIHHKVAMEAPVLNKSTDDLRERRAITHSEEKKTPLRIHSHIDEIDAVITDNTMFIIDSALKEVESYISQTIMVNKAERPFLLERTSCYRRWTSGIHKNKCSHFRKGPEFCYIKDTFYEIPDRYLRGLNVYEYDHLDPFPVFAEGEGADDGNFVLFVISRSTSWCKNQNVQAYGSYCRLDQDYKPIAGLLNLCPEYFSKKLYKTTHYFHVILHEVIHILGFSEPLYKRFKTCITMHNCHPNFKNTTDKHGVDRLLFPHVVKQMQEHFKCSQADFGGPLEVRAANQTNLTAHWHPLLMYSSIMTSSILEDDHVVIDSITLALLNSTGWYTVNFTMAQTFAFGKGGGCNFAFGKSCDENKYLCNASNASKGCDLLHKTIGTCKKILPSHPCGVYQTNLGERCVDEQDMYFGKNFPYYNFAHRCVMVHTNKTKAPTCVMVKCRIPHGVKVYFNSSWIPCPSLQKVRFAGRTLECPPEESLCPELRYTGSTEDICFTKNNFALALRIYFTDPSFAQLSKYSNFKNFKASTLQAIARTLNIPVNFFANSSMIFFKTLYLDFDICPPRAMSEADLCALLKAVQDFLKSPSFTYVFQGIRNLPVASTKYMVDPDLAVAFSDSEGFRMLAIIPVMCAIFIIVTFIASVLRYTIIQRHRPKRETVEMENIDQTSAGNSPQSSSISYQG